MISGVLRGIFKTILASHLSNNLVEFAETIVSRRFTNLPIKRYVCIVHDFNIKFILRGT